MIQKSVYPLFICTLILMISSCSKNDSYFDINTDSITGEWLVTAVENETDAFFMRQDTLVFINNETTYFPKLLILRHGQNYYSEVERRYIYDNFEYEVNTDKKVLIVKKGGEGGAPTRFYFEIIESMKDMLSLRYTRTSAIINMRKIYAE